MAATEAALFLLDAKYLIARMGAVNNPLSSLNHRELIERIDEIAGNEALAYTTAQLEAFNELDPSEVALAYEALDNPIGVLVEHSCVQSASENKVTVKTKQRVNARLTTVKTDVYTEPDKDKRDAICKDALANVKVAETDEDLTTSLSAALKSAMQTASPGVRGVLVKVQDSTENTTATHQELAQLAAALKQVQDANSTKVKKFVTLEAMMRKNETPLAQLLAQVDRLRIGVASEPEVRAATTFNALAAMGVAQNALQTYSEAAIERSSAPRVVLVPLKIDDFLQAQAEVDAVHALADVPIVLSDKLVVRRADGETVRVERWSGGKQKNFKSVKQSLESLLRATLAAVRKAQAESKSESKSETKEESKEGFTDLTLSRSARTKSDMTYRALVSAENVRASDVRLKPVDDEGFVLVDRKMTDVNAHVKVEMPQFVFVLRPDF